jgi:diacylglycerol kinase (ATP)
LKRVTLIYNPVAGRRPARRERQMREAVSILREAGMEVTLAPTTGPGAARELARQAVGQGAELVLVCGGDGTVNEVINGLAPGETVLGILPGGTANILGKELRLPHHPVHAARQLPNWKPRRIALGRASWLDAGVSPAIARRYFISVAGIGFDAYIIHKLAWSFKISWGVPAYVMEAVRQALRYRFPPFAVEMDSEKRRVTFAVLHRSGHYAGWLHLAPQASILKPTFTACLFHSRHWARYFFYAGAVLLRQHLRLSDVALSEGRRANCVGEDPDTPIYFELDGELVGKLPATFEVVPDALTLLVP